MVIGLIEISLGGIARLLRGSGAFKPSGEGDLTALQDKYVAVARQVGKLTDQDRSGPEFGMMNRTQTPSSWKYAYLQSVRTICSSPACAVRPLRKLRNSSGI